MFVVCLLASAATLGGQTAQILNHDGAILIVTEPGAQVLVGMFSEDGSVDQSTISPLVSESRLKDLELDTQNKLEAAVAALEIKLTAACMAMSNEAAVVTVDADTKIAGRIDQIVSCQNQGGFLAADGSCGAAAAPFEHTDADSISDADCDAGRAMVFQGFVYVCACQAPNKCDWVELLETPVGSSPQSPSATCNRVPGLVPGKYWIGKPGLSVLTQCTEGKNAAGSLILLNRGGDGSDATNAAASCGTLVNFWNKGEGTYFFHTIQPNGEAAIVKAACDGTATAGGTGHSVGEAAISCADLDDHHIGLEDGLYWILTDTTARHIKCVRGGDGKMVGLPDGQSPKWSGLDCLTVHRTYPALPGRTDTFLTDTDGKVYATVCIKVDCNDDSLGAAGTSVETECTKDEKQVAVAVPDGRDASSAAPSCQLIAEAYLKAVVDVYWIADPNPKEAAAEVECIIERADDGGVVAKAGVKLGSKSRPADSCQAIALHYVDSFDAARNGLYYIGDSKKFCLFSGGGAGQSAPDGSNGPMAVESCNDPRFTALFEHEETKANVWIQPDPNRDAFETFCMFIKVHGPGGKVEGWTLAAFFSPSTGGGAVEEPNAFFGRGEGYNKNDQRMKDGIVKFDQRPVAAHGWNRMGHYMLLEKTRSRPNEKHPKMTLWEYYSQGGPGDRVQRWYKEYAGVKRPYTWFTQEDAGNPTKNCINRAMTLNCKDSSTYRSTSSTVNTGHTIVCPKCAANPDTCGWNDGNCYQIGGWHARMNSDASNYFNGWCSGTGDDSRWPDDTNQHWGNAMRMFVL